MEERTKLQLMFWFTMCYLTVFTLIAMFNKNYEFLYYTIVVSALIFVTVLYHRKIHLTKHILFGLTLLGAIHIFGGNIHIGSTRLYDMWIIQPNILRYDNIVHTVGIFVTTFVAYSFLQPHLDRKLDHNAFLLSLILISISMGVGAFNEVLEFGAVVFLGAAKSVGDYFNNALDLVYNLVGSIIACFFVVRYRKNK